MKDAKAGAFEIVDGILIGPVLFMDEEGNEALDKILRGDDDTFNMSCQYSPTVETAICVWMQTKYAGWMGKKELIRCLSK